MKYLKTFEDYKFSDIFPKNDWVELSHDNRKELKREVWELVDNAYKPLGGHVRISNPDSVVNDKDLVFWSAVDIDDDPYSDVVIFARKSFGYKISGWGHDGGRESKIGLMTKLVHLLKKPGFWIEVSGKPAEILSNKVDKLPISDVQKIFPNSEITELESGFYTRTLSDGVITDPEIILGNPSF